MFFLTKQLIGDVKKVQDHGNDGPDIRAGKTAGPAKSNRFPALHLPPPLKMFLDVYTAPPLCASLIALACNTVVLSYTVVIKSDVPAGSAAASASELVHHHHLQLSLYAVYRRGPFSAPSYFCCTPPTSLR